MPGMMEEAEQIAAQQSSGPPAQTPPAAATPQSGASGPGQPAPGTPEGPTADEEAALTPNQPSQELNRELPPFQELRDEAIQMVYGDRFDQLISMFETNGADKFPRSMAIAINTPITELEKKYSKLPYEDAAKLAMSLYVRLMEDVVGGGVVEGVTPEHIADAIPATLMMFSSSHPEVSKEDLQQVIVGARETAEQVGDQPQDVPGIEEIVGGAGPMNEAPPGSATGAPPQEIM